MSHAQIRQSTIHGLLEKVRKNNYHKYLKAVRLQRVRGFSGGQVTFEFPVTALIGPNGGGKSTILGAAACAYKEIKPGLFFPKSSIGDNTMSEWSMEYETLDRDVNPTVPVRRSSVFRHLRWSRSDVLSRNLRYFGINRTVPAGEKPQFKKLMKPSYHHEHPILDVDALAAKEIEKVLGKSVSSFRQTKVGSTGVFFVGKNKGSEYSEFHFGAGESSIIRIISEIESLPNSSLVLIEEIENGLHPVAVRCLVEYLIAVAERKSIQSIFTTHSDEALDPLPPEAIWSSLDGQVQQGKLSVAALRAVTGRVDTDSVIFTEDRFSNAWVTGILRQNFRSEFDRIEVHAVAGAGNAIKIHKVRKSDPSIRSRSICVLDGDSMESAEEMEGIFKLPGNQPELTIFDGVFQNASKNLAVITVALHQAPNEQNKVRDVLEAVSRANRDPHQLFYQIGLDLGFVPEETVRDAFITQWLREHEADVQPMVIHIRNALNKPGSVIS
jgi:energy-coupling factor transporter ATP-binding protein EcfA2